MATTLWVDVEDLFEYVRRNSRPSGIQRLAFEIYRALHDYDSHTGRVYFVRHAPVINSLRVVSWVDLAQLFATLTDGPVHCPPLNGAIAKLGPRRQFARMLVRRLPTSLRPAIIEVLLASSAAAIAWQHLVLVSFRSLSQLPRRLLRLSWHARAEKHALNSVAFERRPLEMLVTEDDSRVDFAKLVRSRDVVVVFGAPWSHPGYAALMRSLREKHGVRVAMLVYDLIPLRRPEWFESGLVPLFRHWFHTMLPVCDHVFAISRATAQDLEHYAGRSGVTLASPVVALPIGTGFGLAGYGNSGQVRTPVGTSQRALPVPGTYALIVSTIEVRKNHLLLFRVWRRLLDDLPTEQVPVLVFAGRIGWLVTDLMHQIRNTNNLNGRLVIVESPTDAELAALYAGCLFTLFPSFYEGWGLPVSESLAAGKPCVISNRTSLPEAGVGLARLFDPDDTNDAYRVIRAVIDDREDLARWEAQVRCEFKPVPWSATVTGLLAELA